MTFESRLRDAFPDEADLVLGIIRGTVNPEDIKGTTEWVKQCFHKPKMSELKMHALNEVLKGYGVEAIFAPGEMWPDMEYVNMGDTYATTLVRDYVENVFLITTYGDWIEHAEKKGHVYE